MRQEGWEGHGGRHPPHTQIHKVETAQGKHSCLTGACSAETQESVGGEREEGEEGEGG